MALFQKTSSDAVRAAIMMQAEIRRYNVQRSAQNRIPIQVGMGFHTGSLIMGIIGDEHRSDPAIISDTVNTAARMEGLTKYYRAQILLSGTSYDGLDSDLQAHCRYLGQVQLKGKAEPMRVFECLDGEEASLRDQKLAGLSDFNTGMQSYLQGDMKLAQEVFSTLTQRYPDDRTAAYFMERVQHFIQNGVPADWDGVERMTGK